jgi:hypothetical protein
MFGLTQHVSNSIAKQVACSKKRENNAHLLDQPTPGISGPKNPPSIPPLQFLQHSNLFHRSPSVLPLTAQQALRPLRHPPTRYFLVRCYSCVEVAFCKLPARAARLLTAPACTLPLGFRSRRAYFAADVLRRCCVASSFLCATRRPDRLLAAPACGIGMPTDLGSCRHQSARPRASAGIPLSSRRACFGAGAPRKAVDCCGRVV